MAPITATTTGVTPQVIDDPELVDLITRFSGFRSSGTGAADSTSNKKINLDGLISELSKYKSWRFQEQVRKLMSSLFLYMSMHELPPFSANFSGLQKMMFYQGASMKRLFSNYDLLPVYTLNRLIYMNGKKLWIFLMKF